MKTASGVMNLRFGTKPMGAEPEKGAGPISKILGWRTGLRDGVGVGVLATSETDQGTFVLK